MPLSVARAPLATRYHLPVLVGIIMADIFLDIGILRTVLFPPIEFFFRLLVGV